MTAFVPIHKRMMGWKIPGSLPVIRALAERHRRAYTDAERAAIIEWLPRLRSLTEEPRKRYPFYNQACDQDALRIANLELDEIERKAKLPGPADRNLVLSRATEPTPGFTVPLPEGLELYPFQAAGIEYAQGKRFVLFYDEMGLGKTIQVIGLWNTMPLGRLGRILVVCPATIRTNWANEIKKWCVHSLETFVLETKHKSIPDSAQVVIVGHELLWRRNFLGEYSTVVIDEAHKTKNKTASRARAALEFLGKSNLALVVSGSPIPKDLSDLYSVIEIAMPDVARTFYDRFISAFAVAERVTFTGKNHAELGTLLRSHCMVRRLKKDVLPQLPPKTRQILSLPGIRATYENEEDRERIFARVTQLLEGDKALHQAVRDRKGDTEIDGHIATVRKEQAILKAPYVADYVEELLRQDPARKIVVFGYHIDAIAILQDRFSVYGCVTITGATSNKAGHREALVEAFQTDPKTRVFLGNIYAAGEGITLHAATLAVFAEVDWVWAKVCQAEDRIHRIGATGDAEGKIIIQHILLDDSVDELIVRAMMRKKIESDKVLQ